jgi:hypothetical protein
MYCVPLKVWIVLLLLHTLCLQLFVAAGHVAGYRFPFRSCFSAFDCDVFSWHDLKLKKRALIMLYDVARKGILQKMTKSNEKLFFSNIELAEDFGTQHNISYDATKFEE